MKIDSALQNIAHLFLDTAPVIYYVEKNPQYFATVEFVFGQIDSGSVYSKARDQDRHYSLGSRVATLG